jgi:DNA-binding NtrC family response regulator
LRPEQIALAALFTASILFCASTFWFVASSPDVPVRVMLSSGDKWSEGLVLRYVPGEDAYNGPRPHVGDRLMALGGHPIHSFIDYTRALAELRHKQLATGGRLGVGRMPDELSPSSNFRLLELDNGDRFVHSVIQRDGKDYGETVWLSVGLQPLAPLGWSFIWFLFQLPIAVLTGLAYWHRPEDRSVKLFFVVTCLTLIAYLGGNHWWVLAGAPVLILPFTIAAILLPPALLHFFQVYPAPSQRIQKHPGLILGLIYVIPVLACVGATACVVGGMLLSNDWAKGPFGDLVDHWLGAGAAVLMDALRTGIYIYLGLAAIYFVASVSCLIVNFMKSRGPMERAQMRWIMWAGVTASFPICYTLYLACYHTADFAYGAARAPMMIASALFMVAYGVGIARYKLMLMDQVLSRGMWYYALSAALAGGSGLIVSAIVISALQNGNTLSTRPLAIIFVLAFSILVMGWVRDRLQQSIDRRFFREKYPLDKALQRINRAVTHVLERRAVAEHLLLSCCEALRVERAALYLQDGDGQRFRMASMISRLDVPLQLAGDDAVLPALMEEIAIQKVPSGVSPAQEWLRRYGADLIQGLESDGELVGIVVLGPKANGAAYTAEDVTFITAIGRVTGVALHCAKIHEDIGRLDQDLQEKTQLVSDQARRISFLQAELAHVHGPQAESVVSDFRRDAIKGHSPAIQSVLETVRKVAASESSVLLRGESGTGKELLARAIHDNSPRRDGPLISVHCASLSPTLLESELFGHVRGAFTDAREARIGRIQLAQNGTLFLDEIGDISLETQIKLLRVLQERVIEPVGGTQPIPVDVRLVAATHQNLERLIVEGRFREDLYYRLNVITVTLPPLRERRDDLFELSLHFLRRACEKTGKLVTTIDDDALRLLTNHPWPGNIRELQNVIERAVVLTESDSITVDELPGEFQGSGAPVLITRTVPDDRKRRRAITADVLSAPRRITIGGSEDERGMLEDALRQCNGNKADAARLLNMPRSTYYSKLKKHGLG